MKTGILLLKRENIGLKGRDCSFGGATSAALQFPTRNYYINYFDGKYFFHYFKL